MDELLFNLNEITYDELKKIIQGKTVYSIHRKPHDEYELFERLIKYSEERTKLQNFMNCLSKENLTFLLGNVTLFINYEREYSLKSIHYSEHPYLFKQGEDYLIDCNGLFLERFEIIGYIYFGFLDEYHLVLKNQASLLFSNIYNDGSMPIKIVEQSN
jgi:hypothetical protein